MAVALTLLSGLPGLRAQVTATIDSPPAGLRVVAGAPLPLAASVTKDTPTDGGTVGVTQVQFIFNGQRLLQFPLNGPYVRSFDAPGKTGTYTVQLQVLGTTTDADGTVTAFSTTVERQVTVVAAAPLDDPTPSANLLTALTGRTIQSGARVGLTGTAQSLRPDGGQLERVDFYAGSTRVAAFDGGGAPFPSAAPHDRPHTNDISDNGPAANGSVFRADWTVPDLNRLVNLFVVATTAGGRSQVSTVVPVRVIDDLTNTPPTVAILGVTDGEQIPVGTRLSVAVTASDPDQATGSTQPGARIGSVSGYVNANFVGTTLQPPYGFPYLLTGAGLYVINAIATDGLGLSTVAAPVIVRATAPTVVTFVQPANRQIVEGTTPRRVGVARTGDLSQPLTVSYRTAGGAVSGTDYAPLSGSVTFAAGTSHAKIRVRALDDGAADGGKTLKLILLPGSDGAYTVGTPGRVKLRLIDAD